MYFKNNSVFFPEKSNRYLRIYIYHPLNPEVSGSVNLLYSVSQAGTLAEKLSQVKL